MKHADVGDILRYNGLLVEVVAYTERERVLYLRTLRPEDSAKCPSCGANTEPQEFTVVEGSPVFQEGAQAVGTLK